MRYASACWAPPGSDRHPGGRRPAAREPDRFRSCALAAQRSADALLAQAAVLRPAHRRRSATQARCPSARRVPAGTEVLVGTDGLVAAARGADVVLNAVVGFAGLPVTHRRARGRQAAGPGQQGVPHRRGAGGAEGAPHPGRRDRPGRLRALRDPPVPGRRSTGPSAVGPAAPHRVGRPVPRLDRPSELGGRSRCEDALPTPRGRWDRRSRSTPRRS